MRRTNTYLSLLGVIGGSMREPAILSKPSLTNRKTATMTVPHRLKKYMSTEVEEDDATFQDNALSNMLTERLQELVAARIEKREEMLTPSEPASRALGLEVHNDDEALPTASPQQNEQPFVPTLGKVLSRTGCCSRSESRVLIARGDVTINGKTVTDTSFVCNPSDNVNVVGIQGRLRFSPPRLWMYNKPRNVSASVFDAQGRKVIMAHASILGFDHIIPVSCLPYSQHGLMLLTNDGALASYMEHPLTQLSHVYRLRITPALSPVLCQRLNERGVDVDGVNHKNYDFSVDPRRSKNYLRVKVRGEELPVLDIIRSLGRSVKRGGRVSIGPFQLDGLALGTTREVVIPPSYFKHVGDHWKPFVERDWPFFRRKRIRMLRLMGKHRVLSQKEMEELDAYSTEETQESLRINLQTNDEGLPVRPLINIPLKY